ncbi:MAG: LTA synthase family protein [Woeseiaceae bacterium]|nr:LTA synthase family protein [Woeseiaceae bacterium]
MWNFDRVTNVNGWSEIFISGLRVDIATLSYLFVIPALITCLMINYKNLKKIWLFFLRIWIVLSIWLLVFMEVVTPSFILEYDVRPNRLFVEYLMYPSELMNMLLSGYKTELTIVTFLSSLTLYFSWKGSAVVLNEPAMPVWYWRPLLAILVLLLGVMGARSSLGHRPLNPAMVAFSIDPLMNDLTLNSTYSMLFAVKQLQNEDDAFKYYGQMDEDEVINLVRDSTNLGLNKYFSKEFPTMASHKSSYRGQKKNLVILLQESLGARYVGKLGGLPLTPNIDKLMEEGWNFTNVYATGTRSVRGIEAIITGFSPTPARSVVKLGKSQSGFFSIAHLLKKNGYHTQFIYGGESHFDNMKSFFLGNGFDDMQDFGTFKEPTFVGSWGASDEDLYAKAHLQFSVLHEQRKPFFSLVFTTSNHTPFDYPDGRIELYNQPKETRENAAKYSDYALGKFFENAKKSAYWADTIFLIVADHDSRAYGDQLVPIKHFHIPAVIVGSDIIHRQDTRLASQIDLPQTLLSLIGVDSDNPMIGHDLTQEIPQVKLRAMMQFYKNFAWMDGQNNVVVLQPEKSPVEFYYDRKNENLVGSKESNPELVIKAKANALWGSLAYKKDFYRSID